MTWPQYQQEDFENSMPTRKDSIGEAASADMIENGILLLLRL